MCVVLQIILPEDVMDMRGIYDGVYVYGCVCIVVCECCIHSSCLFINEISSHDSLTVAF